MNRCVSFCLLAIAGIVLQTHVASATILTFDASDSTLDTNVYPNGFPEGYGLATLGEPFNPLSGYGNNVTGPTGAHTNGTTTWGYGVGGEGYTPDVTVQYGPHGILDGGPVFWREDFGDLTNVLYQAGTSPFLEIDLQADTAHDVLLYGFDLGGWQGNYTISAVTVFKGYPNALFTPTNQLYEEFDVLAPGPGNGATSITFNTPIRAPHLFIRITTTGPNGEDQRDVIGIDNIRFGQDLRINGPGSGEVPEPSSIVVLAGLGSLGALGAWRRRRVA